MAEDRRLSDFSDNKIIDIDIGCIIDDYLEEEGRPKTVGAYYPSEIGMCIRRSYYSYVLPKPTEAGALRIFALGNNLHAFIADVLKKSDEFSFVEDERPIKIPYKDEKSSFTIYGRIDDYVITKNTNKKIIIEAKSVGDVLKINEPEPKHVMQLMLYLSAMEADYGMLLYADKKNLNIRQFRVDYDDSVYAKIITRFRDLDLHLRNKKLPPAEYYFDAKKVWECKYCPYFKECMQAIANND
ncbi:MAG: PD-(D/E)XK nuclease family protein [Candidatus Parvarchaeota archaeon]|nr:PD-(D/E)XK nuclease family protein [Candidatus Parvarchaeota archaeon]